MAGGAVGPVTPTSPFAPGGTGGGEEGGLVAGEVEGASEASLGAGGASEIST
jgi:hypothetical protein